MISDVIGNLSVYQGLAQGLDQIIDYAMRTDLSRLPDGRFEIDGDRIFVSVTTYASGDPSTIPFEAHRKYIDLQCVLKGEENLYWLPMSCVLSARPRLADSYSEDKDVIIFNAEGGSPIHLTPGICCVLFPRDAHKPKCRVYDAQTVRKAVFKALIDSSDVSNNYPGHDR